jgi:hypothetical protein
MWTVEKEICTLADTCGDFSAACAILGLGYAEDGISWEERLDWAARGSETYTYAFDLIFGNDRRRSYLLKAFVPHPQVDTVASALNRHLNNGKILAEGGVLVPKVYGARNGTLLTDYIPYDLFDYGRHINCRAEYIDLLAKAIEAASRVHQLGFKPIAGSLDFRTDGHKIYMVDLGTDLGPPGSRLPPVTAVSVYFDWVENQLRNYGLKLTQVETADLRRRVEGPRV